MKVITQNFRHHWSDQEVEAHWDRVAAVYIAENNRVKDTHDQRFKESIRHLQPEPGSSILNISSRDAEADDYIRNAQADVEIIHAEISSGLMEEARKYRPGIKQIKISDYSLLPFADQRFDRILSLETLEHVAEPLAFLSELHRVSKLGATMVLSCPPSSAEWPYRIYNWLFGGHGEGPHRFPHPNEVKQMLKLTSWRLVHHFGSVLIPVGPRLLKALGEKLLRKYPSTWIANLGIRQFYICERAE